MPLATPPVQPNCHFASTGFRVVPTPMIPLPPNHLLLHALCPCGRHRMHFTLHRNLVLAQLARNQGSYNARVLPHLLRMAEIQSQVRVRQMIRKEEEQRAALDEIETEEDVDR